MRSTPRRKYSWSFVVNRPAVYLGKTPKLNAAGMDAGCNISMSFCFAKTHSLKTARRPFLSSARDRSGILLTSGQKIQADSPVFCGETAKNAPNMTEKANARP
jgi:hypothetical protein